MKKLHIPIPYLHFQKPEWILHIEKEKQDAQIDILFWWLKLGDGNSSGPDDRTKVEIPPIKIGERSHNIIGGRQISPLGSTAVCIAPHHWLSKVHTGHGDILLPPDWSYVTPLCEFRSTSEEEYFMPFIAALMAGLIAGLILLQCAG